jgi:glycosyltransferase involved in cell wall biosynthesis
MSKVSVVIIAYNAAKTIAETLASVRAQTQPVHEIIVVNDGSTDDTVKIAESFSAKVVNREHGEMGIGVIRNEGFAVATGDIFLPIDSDDKFAPTFVEKTLPLMTDGVGVVCTDMQYFGTETHYIRSWSIFEKGPYKDGGYPFAKHRDMTLEDECKYNNIPVASLIRREAFEQVGGYHPILWGFEDWSLWISILSEGWKVAVVHEPLFLYRRRGGSLSERDSRRRAELNALMREVHGEKFKGYHDSLA